METFETYLKNNRVVFFLMLYAIEFFVLYFFRNTSLICDEHENYQQILNFSNGDYHLLKISAVPGYHVCMALLFKVTGWSSLFAARCLTVIFGCLSVFVFYLLTLRINPESSVLKTLQFFLFPSIFIYYFVLYTDILSLLFVMIMLLFTIDKRYILAGVFGILSMCIRQNNVLWVAFIPALVYFEKFQTQFSINNIIEIFKNTWVYFLGIALFILFVIVNDGVAVGDSASHPAFKFSTGNLFFILFCFFVFFLPMHIANIPKVIAYLKSGIRPIILSSVFFLVYWFTFKNDHPYNNIGMEYFIRNHILVFVTKTPIRILLFFAPVFYAFLSLLVTPLKLKSWNLFYVITVLFLMPSWLIEQRYYMIPFVIFILVRKDQPIFIERITILYYVLILCLMLPQVVTLKTFF